MPQCDCGYVPCRPAMGDSKPSGELFILRQLEKVLSDTLELTAEGAARDARVTALEQQHAEIRDQVRNLELGRAHSKGAAAAGAQSFSTTVKLIGLVLAAAAAVVGYLAVRNGG